jgi:hypothetical protein
MDPSEKSKQRKTSVHRSPELESAINRYALRGFDSLSKLIIAVCNRQTAIIASYEHTVLSQFSESDISFLSNAVEPILRTAAFSPGLLVTAILDFAPDLALNGDLRKKISNLSPVEELTLLDYLERLTFSAD